MSGGRVVPPTGTGARRGFTAVELMVAITCSLIVCAGAYTLASTSLEIFQHEARMNAAQFSNATGANKLVTDIKRAGFMTSADATSDVGVCVRPSASSPLGRLLKAANVEEGTDAATYGATSAFGGLPAYPALPGEVTDALTNDRHPDRLRLTGNYSMTDRLKLGAVDIAAGKVGVEVDQLAVQRIFRDARDPQIAGPEICEFFRAGTVIRLVDAAHRARFTEIAACVAEDNSTSPPTNYAKVVLTATAIPSGAACGELTGGYVNPVDIIDYAPMHLTAGTATTQGIGPNLATLMDQDVAVAGTVGDGSRLALVRRELSADGSVRPNTALIVADYVADLNFTARAANDPLTPNVLTPVAFDAVGAVPENRIRTLGVRLSTRTRNPDRAVAPPVPARNQPITRFNVFPSAATNRTKWARVRTIYVEANLQNLLGATPW
ncbi:MAG: hypothetical protein HOW73_25135 [Polyangiaceae bacterium]|nr:hypothetical protein [Polyangiaceae bacterium]